MGSVPSAAASQVRDRVQVFVRDVVIPVEHRVEGNLHEGPESVRIELQDAARREGLFAPQVPTRWGGLGLSRWDQSFVLEAAGYSLLGPLSLNCAAPDEGNMHLLEVVGTTAQQEQYLRPLAAGTIRSCFAMTEPAPGAGADPSLLATMATRLPGGDWRLDGRKWFITGAVGASAAICMARTSGSSGDRGGATMFLIDLPAPGVEVVRNIDTLDQSLFGGHAELSLQDVVVGPDAVLGEVDRGFEYAQVRLAPARLTHCMRWLGIAQRAHDVSLDYAARREAFGVRLAGLGMVQQMIADTEIDLAASRALVREAAAELDAGADAAQMSSITKTFVAEAVWRTVDRAVQICGAFGISNDALLGRFLREVRPFRIYDGPSETHRWAIARRALKRRGVSATSA